MSLADILSSPPGGLAYHLIMLFAIQAVLGMALDEMGRSHRPEPRRIAIAFGILFISRLFLMGVALITWQGLVPSQTVLPPLERFLDLLGMILLLYAINPKETRVDSMGRILLAANLALATIVYLVLAAAWYFALRLSPELRYNGYWHEYIWEPWQIAIAVAGVVFVLRQNVRQQVLASSMFMLFALGHLAHVLSLQGGPYVAGWVRVANIIAYPLFAAMTYRLNASNWAMERKRDEMPLLQRQPKLQEDVVNGAAKLRRGVERFEMVARVFGSLELSTVLQRATDTVIKVCDVDLVALLMRRAPASKNLEIAAVHRRDSAYEANKGQIDLAEMPLLRRLLQRQKQIIVEADDDDAEEWTDFLEQIGVSGDYSFIVQPLVAEGASIGALVIADHSLSQLAGFRNNQQILTLADTIALALANALLHETTLTRLRELEAQAQTGAQPVAKTEPAQEAIVSGGVSVDQRSDQQSPDLVQAQLEFERARREAREYASEIDKELVVALRQEISQLQAALAEARSLPVAPSRETDIELIEQLEAELEKARQELSSTRQELEQARRDLQQLVGRVDAERTKRLETELEQAYQELKLTREELQGAYQQLHEQELRLEQATRQIAERTFGVDPEFVERLQTELEQARQESLGRQLVDQVTRADMDYVEHLQAELEKAQRELQLMSQELYKGSPEPDVDLIEHLQSELAEARFETEQLRERVQKLEETIQHQEAELGKRTERLTQLETLLRSRSDNDRLVLTVIQQDLRLTLKLLEGYVDSLLSGSLGALSEPQVKFLRRIKSNTERLGQTMNNLSLLISLDSDSFGIETTEVSIGSLIDQAVLQSKPQAEEKQIRLRVNVPSSLPAIRADSSKLEQILNNLLDNAIRRSPPRSEILVVAEMRKKDDREHLMTGPFVAVSIEDSGARIAPENQANVFNCAEILERGPIKGPCDHGIGLVVARGLVEAHGGKIWLESREGEGTKFVFALPAQPGTTYAPNGGVAYDREYSFREDR